MEEVSEKDKRNGDKGMRTIKGFKRAWGEHKGVNVKRITVKPDFVWDKKRKTFKVDYYTYYLYGDGTNVSLYYHYKFIANLHVDEIERIV